MKYIITENIFKKLLDRFKEKEPEVSPEVKKHLKKLLRKFIEFQLRNLTIGEYHFVAQGYFLDNNFVMGWSGDFLMISLEYIKELMSQFGGLSSSDIQEVILEWYRKTYNKLHVDKTDTL